MGGHMCGQTLAGTVRCAIHQPDMLQVGAAPLLYPILDTLGLRNTINSHCSTEADLNLVLMMLILVLNWLMSLQTSRSAPAESV